MVRIKPVALGKRVAARLKEMQELPPCGLTPLIDALAKDMHESLDPTGVLTAIHRLQRLHITVFNGLQDHTVIVQALHDQDTYPLWDRYATIDASDVRKELLGNLVYEGDVNKGNPALLYLTDYARETAEIVMGRCLQDRIEVDVLISDPTFDRAIFAHITTEQSVQWGEELAKRREDAGRIIQIVADEHHFTMPDHTVDASVLNAYQNAYIDHRAKHTPNLFFTLTTLPTPKAAELEGMKYADYVDLFFDMCAVDWDKIDRAHRFLIAKLNASKVLRFTNKDGTDISMSIEGMTFANSRVAKNVPGSEVFSAPVRDSVNGVIVAKGRFALHGHKHIMENITLRFAHGKLVECHAEKNDEELQRLVNIDEGARYIGEIGIGTNPVLQKHVLNIGMVEKIGGSFHVALGHAYQFTDYLGEPVHVDNGNRSKLHWDITTMLVGKEGMIYLDGVAIMKDGKFVDPELAYLNAA